MRNIRTISTLSVILTLPLPSWSFSPPASTWGISTTAKPSAAASSLHATSSNDNDEAVPTTTTRTKTNALSFLTASVLALNGLTGGPVSLIEPACAAAPPATTVDPLASEKVSVATLKRTIDASSAELAAYNKELSADKKAYERAVADGASSEKRVKAAKAALIESNDKVIKEKAKGETNESSLQAQQRLGDKVGTARTTLKAEEANLSNAKKVLASDTKTLESAEKKTAGASKKVKSLQKDLPKVEKKLRVAEKKLAKDTKAAKKKAAKLAKKQAKKEKIAKKKAAIAENKRKKEAAAKAKKKAEEIAAVKAKVNSLKSLEKSSSSELVKQEKLLQKISS